MNFENALTIFVLACFLGYYIIWGITPTLHSPLMSVSNAISGIVIMGAMTVAGTASSPIILSTSLVAVAAASINVFGGFAISQRMLQMFKKTPSPKDIHDE